MSDYAFTSGPPMDAEALDTQYGLLEQQMGKAMRHLRAITETMTLILRHDGESARAATAFEKVLAVLLEHRCPGTQERIEDFTLFVTPCSKLRPALEKALAQLGPEAAPDGSAPELQR